MLGSVDATLMNDHLFTDYHLAYQLKIVAKLMLLNEERQANRDVFYITNGGHDAHALALDKLHGLLPAINKGITAFYAEMKDQGLLDQVTFVVISEFGRTSEWRCHNLVYPILSLNPTPPLLFGSHAELRAGF